MRVYDIKTRSCCHTVSKVKSHNSSCTNSTESQTKSNKLFHDDSIGTFFRRPAFSPDGELLLTPAGYVMSEVRARGGDRVSPAAAAGTEPTVQQQQNVTHVFTRRGGALATPALHLPCGDKVSVAAAFCPRKFTLRTRRHHRTPPPPPPQPLLTNTDEPMSEEKGIEQTDSSTSSDDLTEPNAKPQTLFDLPYRLLYAVATEDTVLMYDTQRAKPFAAVSNIHYDKLNDISWSSSGRVLAVCSKDGYVTLVGFCDDELGTEYHVPIATPTSLQTNDVNTHGDVHTSSNGYAINGISNHEDHDPEAANEISDTNKRLLSEDRNFGERSVREDDASNSIDDGCDDKETSSSSCDVEASAAASPSECVPSRAVVGDSVAPRARRITPTKLDGGAPDQLAIDDMSGEEQQSQLVKPPQPLPVTAAGPATTSGRRRITPTLITPVPHQH